MLPRLTAEESFAAAQRVAVGSGTLKAGDRREVVRTWERALANRLVPKARRATAENLAALGIKVRTARTPPEAGA